MILETLSEWEFRKDKEAVEALKGFLDSPHGKKFCAVMRGGHILEVLTSSEKTRAQTIRPLALAEVPNAQLLLGMSEGYHLSLKLIDSLTEFEGNKDAKKEASSHLSRVTSVLNKEESTK